MNIDEDMLEQIAKQGLGHIVALDRCPNCNYIATSDEELARRDSPCPNCAVTGHSAGPVRRKLHAKSQSPQRKTAK
jgi:ssDNA-binding Zn-finger/Zn-ribbon topoisomerase 1